MNRVDDSLWSSGDNESLIKALIDAGAEFIVVGGLAVSWYWSQRQADDMDLLINPTSENAVRVMKALRSLRLEVHEEMGFTQPGVQIPLKTWHYAELLTPQNQGESFRESASQAIHGKLFNYPVFIASKQTLIAMKSFADNASDPLLEKHRQDLKVLRSLAEV